jgi:Cellulase (glycosyl hydrolase family 5)
MTFVSRLLAAALVGFALVTLPLCLSAYAQVPGADGPTGLQGDHFVDARGQPAFLLGVNYEGPADRAWKMWDEGNFDANLIASDLDRARAANLSVIRIFVSRSLAAQIQQSQWGELDQVLNLADQRGLRVILTFSDYPDSKVAELAATEAAVAGHYHGRSTFFAFDLKNEPHLGDLALAQFPDGILVALQDPTRVGAIGQTVTRKDIGAYRLTGPGHGTIPRSLSDDQAYVYANVLTAYLTFLDQAGTWARAHHATIVDYERSADSASWNPLKEALNDTFASWLKLQLAAVRGADSTRLVTVGQVDPILASLPANNWLDYRTFHLYPAASTSAIQQSMTMFDAVKAAVPGKPFVLGEFGISNATVGPQNSATLETQIVRAVHDHGGAGALKWMLNDFPPGGNVQQDQFGFYLGSGTAKPVVAAFQAMGVLRPLVVARSVRLADYGVANGHFYTQTNGRPSGWDWSGFTVSNADGIPFWDAFVRRGGVAALGYPVSRRFTLDGFVVQAMQKGILQWQPAQHQVALLNTFDRLHLAGQDDWLQSARATPPPFDTTQDSGQPWTVVVAQHLALLDANSSVRARFLAEPDWLNRFGLPVSVAAYPDVYVVRAQRAVLQQWRHAVPWAKAGQITIANGGDLAKEAGLLPDTALVPEPAP